MKQLSEVLNNTLNTAKQMESVPAVQKFSLTNEDGKMITAQMEQFKAMSPAEAIDNAMTLLKQLGNLQKAPERNYDWVIAGRTGEDAPPTIEIYDMNEKAFYIGKKITEVLFEPISKQEFAMLYAKLKVLCKWHSVPADEKIIMAAYYDELKKYPAIAVREALKPKYEWFPSYVELEKDIKEKGEHLFVLKRVFSGFYEEKSFEDQQ